MVTHKIQLQELQQEYTQQIKQKEIEKMAEIAMREVANTQLTKDLILIKGKLERAEERLKMK